ncbi:MAG: sugar transferase [Clostridia bacterium]|nr:sugar transferase [Clostridia bacterium]
MYTRYWVYQITKRIADFLISLCALVVFSPIFVILAIVAAVDTKASPLFVQTRIGRGGRPFRCFKYRTMTKDAPSNVATCDLEASLYISPVGSFLRKTSLDELPQLINILFGDMSIVGPRPIIPEEMELIHLRKLHGAESVRPGLTGWAQINGRDNLKAPKKAMMDGYYARHASWRMDLHILIQTVAYVLSSSDVVEGHTETNHKSSAQFILKTRPYP